MCVSGYDVGNVTIDKVCTTALEVDVGRVVIPDAAGGFKPDDVLGVATFARQFPDSIALEIEWLAYLLSILMDDVKKDVKNDVIVTSSGHYGAKNALFDHKNRYKIPKSARNCPKIGPKLGLIKFFKI